MRNSFLPQNMEVERLVKTVRGLGTLSGFFASSWRNENIEKLRRGEILFRAKSAFGDNEKAFIMFWSRLKLVESQMRFLIVLYRDFGFLGRKINNIEEDGLHFLCRVGTKKALRLEVATLASENHKVKSSEVRALWRRHNPGKKLKGFTRKNKNMACRLYNKNNVEGFAGRVLRTKDTRKVVNLWARSRKKLDLVLLTAKIPGKSAETKLVVMDGDKELLAVS